MTDTKHTPGPWHANGQTVTAKDNRTFICYCPKNSDGYDFGIPRTEAEANASLIAAAPDLLEALRNLEPMFDNDSPLLTVYAAAIALARAAIAKATRQATTGERDHLRAHLRYGEY